MGEQTGEARPPLIGHAGLALRGFFGVLADSSRPSLLTRLAGLLRALIFRGCPGRCGGPAIRPGPGRRRRDDGIPGAVLGRGGGGDGLPPVRFALRFGRSTGAAGGGHSPLGAWMGQNRAALGCIGAYTAHCFSELGMCDWLPAFVSAVAVARPERPGSVAAKRHRRSRLVPTS